MKSILYADGLQPKMHLYINAKKAQAGLGDFKTMSEKPEKDITMALLVSEGGFSFCKRSPGRGDHFISVYGV